MKITLPWPPSVNHYWRNVQGRMLISKPGRDYRHAVRAALYQQFGMVPGKPKARLSVSIDAWLPDKRKRDLDNLLKAALDACTHAGLWADDSQIDSLTIRRAGYDKPGRLVLDVELM